jgi:hypothetical protein
MDQAKMTNYLGYAKNAPSGNNTGNSRNGTCKKKVKVNPGDR